MSLNFDAAVFLSSLADATPGVTGTKLHQIARHLLADQVRAFQLDPSNTQRCIHHIVEPKCGCFVHRELLVLANTNSKRRGERVTELLAKLRIEKNAFESEKLATELHTLVSQQGL